MYNRMIEIEDLFNEIYELPSELEINNIKKSVKKRVYKHKIANISRNMVIIFLFLIVTFIIGINTSPTFANSMYKFEFLRKFIQAVDFNEGYRDAVANNCMIEVNQKRKTQFGDISLSYYIADEKDMLFFFEFENLDSKINKEESIIYLDSIKNMDNGDFSKDVGGIAASFEDEFIVASLGFWPENFEYPNNIEVTFNIECDNKYETISFILSLEEPLPAKVYEVNKPIEHRGQKYTIEKVTIYPTCTYIEYCEDESNSMEIVNIDFHLIDDEGIERGNDRQATMSDDNGIYIASGYFALGDNISLVLDELYLLPKDKKRVIYDTQSKTFRDKEGVLDYIRVGKKNLSGHKQSFDKNDIPFVIDREDYQEKRYANSFLIVDDKTGECLDTWIEDRVYMDVVVSVFPKSIKNDEDGLITLERNFAEYYDNPNIVITIE